MEMEAAELRDGGRLKDIRAFINLDFGDLRGGWNAFVRGRLAYFRLKRTKSITPVVTAAR
jgi:hypothetical protein